ncbi:LRR receptor-like serine/threonine-protein kinase GSO2 [Capsicum annuum]|uniref:LRR receptor-like serine/threonine-protein kinase GSO2 n=1 Tax=Capsicum annuum TaxID=4072 RepID=UPI001FB10380|nr:LRR receptor-like serine/threonine-protein kinase GSO2 [Capsicum annuum]
MSYNSLQGNIPEEIGNLHNMNLLSIQYNQLTGSIPLSVFNISRIENIGFTGNGLSGSLPNGLRNGLPILKGIYLSSNKLRGHMPTTLSSCSQLQILSLSDNEFDGPIHSERGRLSNLQILYLGTNHVTGEIPKEISNLVELELLNLWYNSFRGRQNMEIFNISGVRIIIEVIAFSGNSLLGYLPYGLCNGLPTLKGLYLWKNKLCGHMPTSLSNCSQLQISALPNNEFGGPMHSEFGRLRIIPQEIENLVNLVELAMEKNQITCSVQISIFNISLLQILFVWENNLSGFLPREISSLIELEELHLAFNSFGGSLPMEIFNISRLRVIDLTNNNLSGSLPPNMGSILPNIEELYMGNLTNLVGNIPHSSPIVQNLLLDSQLTWIFDSSTVSKFRGKQFNQRLISKLPNFLNQLQKFNNSGSIFESSKRHASCLHGEPFHIFENICCLQFQDQRENSK